MANAPQKNIPEKPQIDNGQWTMDTVDERKIDNGQWTHLMSEIQVFNMFKLLKVVLLCSSAGMASSGKTSTCC